MKLWNRASGALKDRNSIWLSTLSRKTPYHNPDLQIAVIKATSHDQYKLDYKNVQRVFQWLGTSPSYSKPLIAAISRRMDRTGSWVVALKGLMLMHGVFCSNAHVVKNIRRLPFDLSDFSDRHSSSLIKVDFAINAFVRSYFIFLDQKSAISAREWRKGLNHELSISHHLLRLDDLQTLLEKLLRVKPLTEEIMQFELVIEAMDCIIIEIFEIYGSICDGVSRVLLRIYESQRAEAAMCLKILKRASAQGHKLREYFEFCRKYGLLSATEFPNVVEIPEEDIKELEQIINGGMEKIVEMEAESEVEDSKAVTLRTVVVTEKWEVFEENVKVVDQQCGYKESVGMLEENKQPVVVVLPDLITF